ncbi:hypothetical protein L6258_02025, partial [Candidatus Parcubacteria bacterium]|nr:hypothetical protein [Candidatus Parcubacteria bacterium]
LVSRLDRKRLRLAFGAVFLAFLPIFFITRNSHEKLYWLFDTLPFLYRFRNPVRPLLFLATCFAPMVALTVEGGLRVLGEIWGKWGRRLATVALGIALLPLVYYTQPFFSGDLTMAKNRGTGYRIPTVHYEIGAWLEEQRSEEETFRTLWVPWTHEETEAKLYWIDPYAYAVPINYGAYVQNDYLEFMKSTYLALATEGADAVRDLAQAGVRYVILNTGSQEQGRARFEYGYQTPWLLGAVGDWGRILQNYEELTLVEEFDGYRVFENQTFDWEKVDLERSGLEPENIEDLTAQRKVLLGVSLIAWGGIVIGWLFTGSPQFGSSKLKVQNSKLSLKRKTSILEL